MKAKRDMEKSTFKKSKAISENNFDSKSNRATGSVSQNQRGQMTLEMILLTVVLVGVAMAATKGLRDREIVAKLVGQPWRVVQGMIEDGVWMKQGTLSKQNNPGNFKRRVSTLGDTP